MEETVNLVTNGSVPRAGAGARVLREIIRTPAFLEIIKMHARDLDPESAREAVRTFLWEDPEISLSLIGTMPEVVNYAVAALLELGRQMESYPEGLLDQFVREIAAEIDVERIRQLPAVLGPMIEKTGSGEAAATAFGKTVNAMAGVTNRAAARNPYFLRDAVSGVDWKEVLRAGAAVARSAALWLASGVSRLFGGGRSSMRGGAS
jgi:hypothetical protein